MFSIALFLSRGSPTSARTRSASARRSRMDTWSPRNLSAALRRRRNGVVLGGSPIPSGPVSRLPRM